MLQPTGVRRPFTRRLKAFGWRCQAALFWLSICGLTGYAQGSFVSGSTGADGAFNPSESQTVPLPESGVFNFTTVNIPFGVTIRFGRNTRNTPVTILATGNVTIAGAINVSGLPGTFVAGGIGGPGGFNGGAGGPATVRVNDQFPYSPGVNGDGPGGGSGGGSATTPDTAGTGGGGGFASPGLTGSSPFDPGVNHATGGPKYGLPTLLPLIGGSGGGGDTGRSSQGGGGGGGGGALLIASSGTINFVSAGFSRIEAGGGLGLAAWAGSGGGSGGAVRLIANVISGDLRIDAGGGRPGVISSNGTAGGLGGGGYLRLEALDLTSLNVVHTNIYGSIPRVTTAIPGVVTPSNLPAVRIVSVAGIAPPNRPAGSLQGHPDIVLPANQSNPVTVALAASNIPPGTTLQVTLTPENGARIVTQSTALAGTLASTTASASVSLPDGISVVQAAGTIDVAGTQLTASNGEKVKRIEVTATYGGRPTVTYITESGRRIAAGQ